MRIGAATGTTPLTVVLVAIAVASFCVASVASAAVKENPLQRPSTGEIWRVGGRYAIQWDPLYRLPDNVYYNNFTRLRVELRSAKDGAVVAQLVDEYPFAYGSVYWTPRPAQFNSSVPGVDVFESRPSVPASAFYIQAYPTYFTWPGESGCHNCMDKGAMKSGHFALVSNCTNIVCAPEVELKKGTFVSAGGIMSVPNGDESDSDQGASYMSTLRSVGLGVGVTVFVGFLIVGLLYTKRTRRSWHAYRQRRSGVVYKPSTSTMRRPPTGAIPPVPPGTSSLNGGVAGTGIQRQCFSVVDDDNRDQWSEMEMCLDDESPSLPVAPPPPAGSSVANTSNKLFPQHARLHTLQLPQNTSRPVSTAAELQDFMPPRADTPLKIAIETAGSTGNSNIGGNTNLTATNANASPPPVPNSSSMPAFSSIHPAEAIMVGNTFRNALRVVSQEDTTEDDDDDLSGVGGGASTECEDDNSYITNTITNADSMSMNGAEGDCQNSVNGGENVTRDAEDSTPRVTEFSSTVTSPSMPGASPATAQFLDTLGRRAQTKRTQGFDAPSSTGDAGSLAPPAQDDVYGISPVLSGMRWMVDDVGGSSSSDGDTTQ